MQHFLLGLERLVRLFAKRRSNGHVLTDQVNSRQDPGGIGYMTCQVRVQPRAEGFKVAARNRVFVAAKSHQQESPERVHMSDGGCLPKITHPFLINEYCT